MDWLKEFIRPNRWKIGLLIVLILLVVGYNFVFPYDPLTDVPCGLEQSNIKCDPWSNLLFNFSFILVFPVFLFAYEQSAFLWVAFGLVVNVLWLYFLSCLVYTVGRKTWVVMRRSKNTEGPNT